MDIQQPLGGDPSPSQFAMAREKWNQLLAGQPEHYQAILRLRYAGESIDNIASELNVNEQTVAASSINCSRLLIPEPPADRQ